MEIEFKSFGKIPRLSRDIVITEKIDGTNGQIYIDGDTIMAGSRNRWITPQDDNHGFAAWVSANREQLMALGNGRHFGEWWGAGIQDGYGQTEKFFSLFNTRRWCDYTQTPKEYPTQDPRIVHKQERAPMCCKVVPVLYEGVFDTMAAFKCIVDLQFYGSVAATGHKAEGVIIYHVAANQYFKKTIECDEEPKTIGRKR